MTFNLKNYQQQVFPRSHAPAWECIGKPMGKSRYKFVDPRLPHFLTCTVLHWIPVFTRPETADIVFNAFMEKTFPSFPCSSVGMHRQTNG